MQEKSASAVTQQFTYMLMKTGTMVLKAETDMKGYTAGDIIQVMAKVHNQSGKSTGNIGAGLVQVMRPAQWMYISIKPILSSPPTLCLLFSLDWTSSTRQKFWHTF